MQTRRRLCTAALVGAPLVCCHPPDPLAAADACACSPREYCHVVPPPVARKADKAALECLPFPKDCGETPRCNCIGRPIDACREELGAFAILEPRPVDRCGDCGAGEYCWHAEEAGTLPMCRVLPARCDSTPTCACLLLTAERNQLDGSSGPHVACSQHDGRLEASMTR